MTHSVDPCKLFYRFHLYCNWGSLPEINIGNIPPLSVQPNNSALSTSIRQIDYILLVGYFGNPVLLSNHITLLACSRSMSQHDMAEAQSFSGIVACVAPQDDVSSSLGPLNSRQELSSRLRGSSDVYSAVGPHCKCAWLRQRITHCTSEVRWRRIANITSLVWVTVRSVDSALISWCTFKSDES